LDKEILNKIATTAEPEKIEAGLRSTGQTGTSAPTWSENQTAAQPTVHHGWFSRWRSYFVLAPLIWVYTVILGTISLLSSLVDRDGRIQHKLARFWSWLIMKTILSPVKVTGMNNVGSTATHVGTDALVCPAEPTGVSDKPDVGLTGWRSSAAVFPGTVVAGSPLNASKPRVYAVTHASALDIPILYVHLPFQFRIIFKSELLSYPFVGWHLKRSGQVCINQQNPAASIGSVKSALRSLRNGMPLVIFPEGGRTRDGELQPFLPGAFFLAIKAQADIVPIALVGTFDLLPMNTYHIKCQPLEMRVGEVISTVGLTAQDTAKVSAQVRAAIESLYSAPRA
jgi:1-acyl-sn-glycerol-3-phosphate acyltransferase